MFGPDMDCRVHGSLSWLSVPEQTFVCLFLFYINKINLRPGLTVKYFTLGGSDGIESQFIKFANWIGLNDYVSDFY